jgi:hypothetical protein
MQLQGGTHLVIPSVVRFLLMPTEDSYRLETALAGGGDSKIEKRPGESTRPV